MEYECTKCKQKFSTLYALDRHKMRKYPCSYGDKCEYCGKEFGNIPHKKKSAHITYCRRKMRLARDTEIVELRKEIEELKRGGTGNTTNLTQNNTHNGNNIQIIVNPYTDSKNYNILDLEKTLAICSKFANNPFPRMIEEAHIISQEGQNIRPQSKAKATPDQDWEVFDGQHFVRKDFPEIYNAWTYQVSNAISDLILGEEVDPRLAAILENTISDIRSGKTKCQNIKDVCRLFYNAIVKGQI